MICGVCGGIGEYFGIDANIVRLIFGAAVFLAGASLLLYILAAIILPVDDGQF